MKRKRLQVTCLCKSCYSFPHRIGGGKCNGREWAESYFTLIKDMCEGCTCNNNYTGAAQGERSGTCDVAEGLESITLCEGYRDHLNAQPSIRLPTTEEEMLQRMEKHFINQNGS